MFTTLLTCLLLGGFAGLAAGLLGVGGGLLIVPVLAGLFDSQGFSPAFVMQLAVGTSLATIVITSLSSAWSHHRRGAVIWRQVAQLGLGILFGAWLGAAMAHRLDGGVLSAIFALFEFAVAAQMLWGGLPAAHRRLPGRLPSAAAGLVIGAVSAILGIGGGTLTVPWLVWHNVDIRQAVGTSAACGLPIALAGALGFVVAGWRVEGLPPGATGYVYWPAAGAIVLTSMLAAPLGAHLAHTLPRERLKKAFAGLLVLLGLLMLSRLWST
jgi:uncharacterized membrane protein YfcA